MFEKWEDENESNKHIKESRKYQRFSPAQITKWISQKVWNAVKNQLKLRILENLL